jgi:hypothetical protein
MKRDSHVLNPSFNIAVFVLCLIDVRAMYNRIKTLTKEKKKQFLSRLNILDLADFFLFKIYICYFILNNFSFYPN